MPAKTAQLPEPLNQLGIALKSPHHRLSAVVSFAPFAFIRSVRRLAPVNAANANETNLAAKLA